MRTRFNFSGELLNYLEFTTLDILNDVTFLKPIFYIFKSTRLVKNYLIFNSLKEDILEKLQIQKMMKQMKVTKGLKKKIKIIAEQIHYMEDDLLSDDDDDQIWRK